MWTGEAPVAAWTRCPPGFTGHTKDLQGPFACHGHPLLYWHIGTGAQFSANGNVSWYDRLVAVVLAVAVAVAVRWLASSTGWYVNIRGYWLMTGTLTILVTSWEQKGHWNGTLCLEKLKDTGSKENHGCDGLTASRKQPAYDWKTEKKQYKIGKNGVRWWKKSLGIENRHMWSEFRRRQWQTTPVQLNLPRKSSVGSPGV